MNNRQLKRSDLPKNRISGNSLHIPVITKRGVKKFVCDIHFNDETLCYLEGAKGKATKIETLFIPPAIVKVNKQTNGLMDKDSRESKEKPALVEPPIGLIPKWVREKERLNEVREAIVRYYDAEMEIPIKWVEEYNELIKLRKVQC